MVSYGTYFGGSLDDSGTVVVVDSTGSLVIAGETSSPDLVGTAGRYQPSLALGVPNSTDVFVAKFDSTGKKLLWATYLGGNSTDTVTSIALDSSDNIYLAGTTSSTNFPFTLAAGSSTKGFAAKLSSNGTTLVYSAALPLSPATITVNSANELYVAGSGNFATLGALAVATPPVTIGGFLNLIKLNSAGSQIIFGAVLGGGGSNASAISLDAQGNVMLAGTTAGGMLTTPTALQATYANGSPIPPSSNGFLLKVDPTGTKLLYGTYFGAFYGDTAITSMALTPNGSVYVAGITNATSYTATPGAFQSSPGGFLAEISAAGDKLQAFSYLPSGLIDMKFGADGTLGSLVHISGSYEAIGTGSYYVYEEFFQFNATTLSLLARTPVFQAGGLAANADGGFWAVGTTYATSNYGGLFVTSDAFQSMLKGSSDSFLAEVTIVNPTISIVGGSATGAGPFAVGQLVSIFGSQLGPSSGVTFQVGSDGAVTNTLAGVQVFFDDVPAPILFANAHQINTVVPCSTARHDSTQLVVMYQGAKSTPLNLRLSSSAPGFFTVNGTGAGQAAALNQDYTPNSPTNPAPRGSVVMLYATGLGQMTSCVDGQIYQSNFPQSSQSVVVGIGGIGAQVSYSGQAPYLVSGVAQVNAVVPSNAETGNVSLALLVGGTFSPSGVTISVK